MTDYSLTLKKYEQINSVVKADGIVFFGSNYLSELPLSEMLQDFNVTAPIHNRSVSHLSINDAESAIDTCILSLHPKKVFINIGDEDIEYPRFDCEEFIRKYEWFLYTLHKKCSAKLYIVSIISESPIAMKVNRLLEELASELGCQYIDAAKSLHYDQPNIKIIDIIKQYVRTQPIDFTDAMSLIAYKQ